MASKKRSSKKQQPEAPRAVSPEENGPPTEGLVDSPPPEALQEAQDSSSVGEAQSEPEPEKAPEMDGQAAEASPENDPRGPAQPGPDDPEGAAPEAAGSTEDDGAASPEESAEEAAAGHAEGEQEHAEYSAAEVRMLMKVREHPTGIDPRMVGPSCNVEKVVAYAFINKMVGCGMFRRSSGRHATLISLTPKGAEEMGKHCL